MSQINKFYLKQDQVLKKFSKCAVFISQQTVSLHVLQEFSEEQLHKGVSSFIYNGQLHHIEG